MKHNNPTWKDVIPVDQLPLTKWCLDVFIEFILSHKDLFSTEDDRNLFRNWQHLNWLDYYEQLPNILSQVGSVISGSDLTCKTENKSELGNDFLNHAQSIFENAKKNIPGSDKEQELVGLVLPNLLPLKLGYLVLANHFACYIKYKTTVNDLIAEIKEGCDEAIFELVSVDHIFIELPQVRNRIREASLFCDADFLIELGRAVELPSIRIELSEYKDDILLLLAWNLGFNSVGLEQFGIFLHEIGFTRFNEISSLRRKLNKIGISTKKIKKDTKK